MMVKVRHWTIRIFMVVALSSVGIGLGLGFVFYQTLKDSGLDSVVMPLIKSAYVLHQYYVEPIDRQQTKQRILGGLIDHLDPHTSYLPPQQAKSLADQLKGSYGGIGIGAKYSDDKTSLVIRDMADVGPAHSAQLMPGDAIVGINGHAVSGKSLQDNFQMIRGPIGTRVELEIVPKNGGPHRKVSVARAAIELPSTQWTLLDVPGGKVFWLREARFNQEMIQHTYQAMLAADAEASGHIKGIILDLRDNPGGLVTAAVGLASFFGEQGALVVSAKGRDSAQNQAWHALRDDWTEVDFGVSIDSVTQAKKSAPWLHNAPMVVLVNRRSASASEIVAGALKDWKRATIVGNDTFGKGSVQSIISLGEGNGSVKITTSRYYTPLGKAIQAVGVPVDIKVSSALDRGIKEADLPQHLKGESGAEAHGDALSLLDGGGNNSEPLDFKDTAVAAEIELEEQRSTFSTKLNPLLKDIYLQAAIKALKL